MRFRGLELRDQRFGLRNRRQTDLRQLIASRGEQPLYDLETFRRRVHRELASLMHDLAARCRCERGVVSRDFGAYRPARKQLIDQCPCTPLRRHFGFAPRRQLVENVLVGDETAGPHQLNQSLDRGLRLALMQQHEPAIGQVSAVSQPERV